MKLIKLVVIWIALLASSLMVSAADLDSGISALHSKRYSDALSIFLPLANSGNADAQRLIGEMSYSGQGMTRDLAAAFKWNELAAEGGNSIAQYNVGYLYERGEGVAPSLPRATAWYIKSALQGYHPAKHKLGDLYAETDRDKALYWYDSARVHGDAVADSKYAALLERKAKDVRAANARNDAIDTANMRAERLAMERRIETASAEMEAQAQQRRREADTPSTSQYNTSIGAQILSGGAANAALLNRLDRQTAIAGRADARLSANQGNPRAQNRGEPDGSQDQSRASGNASTVASATGSSGPAQVAVAVQPAANPGGSPLAGATSPSRPPPAKDEGRVVNQVISGESLEENQAKTWCQQRVPAFRQRITADGDKVLSMGPCSCKSGGALVTLNKLFTCEFSVSLRLFGMNPAK